MVRMGDHVNFWCTTYGNLVRLSWKLEDLDPEEDICSISFSHKKLLLHLIIPEAFLPGLVSQASMAELSGPHFTISSVILQ